MKSLLGKKVGMTRFFKNDGKICPATVLELGPCFVISNKSTKKDGYEAVILGYLKRKKAKSQKKIVPKHFKYVKEFSPEKNFEVGQEITVNQFSEGEKVTVVSISKGKGFTGVVKRHGFKGSPKTHGHKHDLRAPGAIGCGFPEHVVKGRRMAGRMGTKNVTTKNLEILKVDDELGVVLVKGSIPGSRNSFVQVFGKEEKEGKKK